MHECWLYVVLCNMKICNFSFNITSIFSLVCCNERLQGGLKILMPWILYLTANRCIQIFVNATSSAQEYRRKLISFCVMYVITVLKHRKIKVTWLFYFKRSRHNLYYTTFTTRNSVEKMGVFKTINGEGVEKSWRSLIGKGLLHSKF